jgi:hypothetical protein
MPAEAEIVFDVASDVDLMRSWLTADVTDAGPNRLHIAGELDGRPVDRIGLIGIRPDQLRIEWGSEDDDSYAGWLQVAHGGAGASSVTIHLSFLGDQPEARGQQQQVETEIDGALQRLADHVLARTGG